VGAFLKRRTILLVKKQVILLNDSRLMREMLIRVLNKSKRLRVIRQVKNEQDLEDAIQETNAEWVLMTLPADGHVPNWITELNHVHPKLRFLSISIDGSHIKMSWLESKEKDLDGLSLEELLEVLENEPHGQPTG
jgi:hypothetical protein